MTCRGNCDRISAPPLVLPVVKTIDFELRTDYIPLDDLLKATGLAPSGGAAKVLISEGRVQVDGEVERRKACKVYPGQVVDVQGSRIRMHAPTRPAPLA